MIVVSYISYKEALSEQCQTVIRMEHLFLVMECWCAVWTDFVENFPQSTSCCIFLQLHIRVQMCDQPLSP